MSELSELNSAIIELNELWTLCNDDDQCEKILEKRDKLDSQARELANKTLREEGTVELDAAISALNTLTQEAISAKEEIDDIAERIRKTANAIDKAESAISKVASLIDVS